MASALVVGWVLFATVGAATVRAQEPSSQLVDGVRIYLGVLPARMIRGAHPAEHPERDMHGGVPPGPDDYHVVVALFDERTGERISTAKATARVSIAGIGGEEKSLDPVTIAETLTFGNYFTIRDAVVYRISVSVTLAGSSRALETTFQYKRWHP